jgi:hypothetical protein
MRKLKQAGIGILLGGILLVTAGWGFLVHKTVHQLAVYELPKEIAPFFFSNMDYLVTNAPRPDTRRNQDSTEATKHFIDLEMYGPDAANKMPMDWNSAVKKYTKDSLLKYGYVPYHILYMKDQLTEAFRKKNKDSILFYATDLGHYIGDANVPLHTTVNYDGQLTNQKGLHSLWESMIPEIEIGEFTLYSSHQATYLKNPGQAVWEAIRMAAAQVPLMLEKEKEVSKNFTEDKKFRVQIRRGRESKSYTTEFARAYSAALKPTINGQLLRSANLVADIWYTSWVDAGKPALNDLIKDWNPETEARWNAELKAFKENKLLENKWLLSKKTEARETE